MRSRPHRHRYGSVVGSIAGVLAVGLTFAGIGAPTAGARAPAKNDATTVRLGYFPNTTHAPALVGIERQFFADRLGNVDLEIVPFNAGGLASEALLSDSIDLTFIGPNPAINAFVQSEGAVKIVSGSTSGGAFFVVKPRIDKPADLKGTVIATPQLGNTQDVALRVWLQEHNLSADEAGGGDVSIRPQENALTLQAFQTGDIDGAWVPEPWATRLIEEGGGKVLVDERDLWPNGEYVTTHLLVRTDFLRENPKVVKAIIEGELAAIDHINTNRRDAEEAVADGILEATGNEIAPDLVTATFDNVVFTVDPIASSLFTSAKDAERVGLLEPAKLKGIYALRTLNQLLAQRDEAPVASK